MADWASLAASGAASSLGAASQVASTWMNMLGNYFNTYMDYRLQQNAIDRQNEYNSPKNQMGRYMEAGLNPQLIYGQGQTSAGNQSSVVTPHLTPWNVNLNGVGEMLNDSIRTYLAMKANNAQVNKLDAEAGVANAQREILSEDLERKRRENFIEGTKWGLPVRAYAGDPQYSDILKTSPNWDKYDAERQTARYMANYYQIRNDMENLNVQQQKWILANKNKLELEYLQLRNNGMSQNNALHKIRLDLNKTLESIGGETGANLLWKIISFILQNAVIMNSSKY